MSYNYKTQKPNLFTEEGQILFLKIRNNVFEMLSHSGAVMSYYAWSDCTGDSWDMLACLDRMIELGEIREITHGDVPGQSRVFIATNDKKY